MNKNIRIVEASVNGVRLWRVYINQELVATLPTQEAAMQFAKDKSK